MSAHPLLLVARQELVLAIALALDPDLRRRLRGSSRWPWPRRATFSPEGTASRTSRGPRRPWCSWCCCSCRSTSLLIGVSSLAPERGAAELLFSQPISRRTILLGKLLGLFEALVAAQALGFGAAGVVIFSQSGEEGLSGFLILCAASAVLTAIFLAVAAFLAATAIGRRRTRALALALVVWFVAVVLFDVAALGLASLLASGPASRVLIVSVLVNPVDAVRTAALLGIEGAALPSDPPPSPSCASPRDRWAQQRSWRSRCASGSRAQRSPPSSDCRRSMSDATSRVHSGAELNLKSVALPVEHGGWGMLGEPLLLGLLVAPSWAGLGVGLASIGAFLAHHPVRIALADWRRGSAYPRTAAAWRFALLYGATAAAGLVLAGWGEPGWWLPLAASAPLALTQLAYDARNRGRQLVPELLGGVALSSVVAAEMRAGGLRWGLCLAAWLLLAAKAVGAVLYVRTRLRHDRGLAPSRSAPMGAHAGGLLLAVVLAGAGYAPWLTAPAFILLLARAAHGLSPRHVRVRPQVVGVLEMAYGLTFVLILALGYSLQ